MINTKKLRQAINAADIKQVTPALSALQHRRRQQPTILYVPVFNFRRASKETILAVMEHP
jgi:hypothetical protein